MDVAKICKTLEFTKFFNGKTRMCHNRPLVLTIRLIKKPEASFDTFSQLTTTRESLLVMREHILRYTHRTDTVTVVAIAVWTVPELAP